ncbi:hypothetical protein KVT40_006456 [Elsinoe batatas]|uniref:AAA+ ATPase domain-containing protein n=1 Tax=Elsinoe batatas TaxID=2601811 RepID=A0A8K0PBQ4_9PEZI|nr:hypothetical protein KVT40_006456 [Elsinoe batatas]
MDFDSMLSGLRPTARRSTTKKRRRHSTSSEPSSDDSFIQGRMTLNPDMDMDIMDPSLIIPPLPGLPGRPDQDILPEANDAGSTNKLCEFGMKGTTKDFYRSKPTSSWKPWKPGQENAALMAQNHLQQHALVVKREKDTESLVGIRLHSIMVQSPIIKKILESVFDGYRGVSMKLNTLKFQHPFREFVHRWDKLLQAAEETTDDTERKHIALLIDVLKPDIGPVFERIRDGISNGVITCDDLWFLFEPGAIVHTQKDNMDRAYLVEHTEFVVINGESLFQITCCYVDNDGETCGAAAARLLMASFEGAQPIKDIKIQPLDMRPDKEDIRSRLIDRGRNWQVLVGPHHKAYSGVYLRGTPDGKYVKEVVDNGRIMIDGEMYENYSHLGMPPLGPLSRLDQQSGSTPASTTHSHMHHDSPNPAGRMPYRYRRYFPGDPFRGKKMNSTKGAADAEGNETIKDQQTTLPALKDEHLLLCTNELRGYCLTKKAWVVFSIENMREVDWNKDAFPSLVLPEQDKEILYAFADSQVRHGGTQFDDVIEGKGQGIIILLSGPPGVGKTLTAESIAEEMKRPLYAVSSAELGDMTGHIEASLSDVLEICAKWDAVLLIDECDVFLAQREKFDSARNRMVGVFLRQLEYHKGLLFLTTNRHDDFDPAFASRIDLALDYPNLEAASRKAIWTTFLTRQTGKNSGSNGIKVLPDGDGDGGTDEEKATDTANSGSTPDKILPKMSAANGGDNKASLVTDEQIEKLARIDLNGREIKNVVKSAHLLASREGKTPDLSHINKVLRVRVPKEKLAGHMYY